MTVKRYNPIGIPGEVMQPDECGGFVGWADHDALQHQNQHLLTCTKNAGRRIESLEAECLALKEHCAALESREVCTVAHEDVETCGYCQRDALAARLAETEARYQRVMAVIRSYCAKHTPSLLAEFDAATESTVSESGHSCPISGPKAEGER